MSQVNADQCGFGPKSLVPIGKGIGTDRNYRCKLAFCKTKFWCPHLSCLPRAGLSGKNYNLKSLSALLFYPKPN
jgi:hypothetical protein